MIHNVKIYCRFNLKNNDEKEVEKSFCIISIYIMNTLIFRNKKTINLFLIY